MGCHTWIYCHVPEKQDELKKKITEEGVYWANYMIDFYKNPDNTNELHKDFNEFHEDCVKMVEYYEHETEETLTEVFGSVDTAHEEIEWSRKAIDWTYDDYLDWCISENQNLLDMYAKGGLRDNGSFKYDDSMFCGYAVIDDKIYIDKHIPHGNDIGRIHDYNQPDCWTADETIECFKSHNEECDEKLIRELFDKYDMFVHFG